MKQINLEVEKINSLPFFMAFTKKKKRRIIVDEKTYYYVVIGKDGWISLIIMSKFERSPKLILNPVCIQHSSGYVEVVGSGATPRRRKAQGNAPRPKVR